MRSADGDHPDAVRDLGCAPVRLPDGSAAAEVRAAPLPRRPPAALLIVASVLVVAGTGTAAVVGSLPDAPSGTARSGVPAAPAPAGDRTASGADTMPGEGDAAVDPATALLRADAVRPLLSARSAAVRSGRRTDWEAGLDPSSPAFRRAQLAVLDRIRLLPPVRWRYELVGTEDLRPAGASAGGGTDPARDGFLAHVRLHYRLEGDTRDVVRDQYLTVVRRGRGWYLAGDVDPRTQPAVWELGDLTVRHGRRCLVVGIGDPKAVEQMVGKAAALADTAAGDVDAVWGTGWPRRPVVVVPQRRRTMAAVLGRDDDPSLDQVAAVTSGELDQSDASTASGGTARGGVADRVVLNPGPFGRLSDLGRRVVLTHELTHVATRASVRRPAPLWVEEGFANYVAYRTSGLEPAVVAADVLPLVRAGSAPPVLPDAAAFDPAKGSIAVAYADAWLAFDLMAGQGTTRPLRFYQAVTGVGRSLATTPAAARAASPAATVPAAGAAAVSRAFREVLGTTQDAFEARWRTYRAEIAGAAAPVP